MCHAVIYPIADKIAAAVSVMLADPGAFGEEQLAGGGAIARVEAKLCEWYGVEHCLLVNNATNGLFALALAAGLSGSEVIVPPRSYGATYAALEFLNNELVFAQPDMQGNMSPESVEALITPQTKAVWAVDCEGQPHNTAALRNVCAARRVAYFADAAGSLGKWRGDFPASACADAWVVSFGPFKPLYCGEGGAILTRDQRLYKRLVWITQHTQRYRREFTLAEDGAGLLLNARIHPLAAVIAEELLPMLLIDKVSGAGAGLDGGAG